MCRRLVRAEDHWQKVCSEEGDLYTYISDLIRFLFQSILAYNGGSVVAMKGKNCVAIATDLRFGVQAQTITTDFEVTFPATLMVSDFMKIVLYENR